MDYHGSSKVVEQAFLISCVGIQAGQAEGRSVI